MPRTLFEHLSPDTGAKRILALDGGGVKSVLTLGLLAPLEDELRRRAGGDPAFRLCDYYDLIGGASTGALIATLLALGFSVEQLTEFFLRAAPEAYGRAGGDGAVRQARFEPARLRRALQPALGHRTLGSEDLRTGLAISAKRVDAGAAWLVSNHPLGPAYDPPAESGLYPHKRYRLIDLVLASTGAPSLLDAQPIDIALDERRKPLERGWFLDAAAGGQNNPGFALLMLALTPATNFGWKAGAGRLMMTSLGAGARRPHMEGESFAGLSAGLRGAHALSALAFEADMQGVLVMQALAAPRRPWRADQGAGAMITEAPLLDYQRIDVALDTKPRTRRHGDPKPPMTALERMLGRELAAETLEALGLADNGGRENMALLLEIGKAAARGFIDAAYPDPQFDPPEWRSLA